MGNLRLSPSWQSTLPSQRPLSIEPTLGRNIDPAALTANSRHDLGRDFHVAIARRRVELGQAREDGGTFERGVLQPREVLVRGFPRPAREAGGCQSFDRRVVDAGDGDFAVLAPVPGPPALAPAQQALALTADDDGKHHDASDDERLPSRESGASVPADEGSTGEAKPLPESLGE